MDERAKRRTALDVKRALSLDTILEAVKDDLDRHALERYQREVATARVNERLKKAGKPLRVL